MTRCVRRLHLALKAVFAAAFIVAACCVAAAAGEPGSATLTAWRAQAQQVRLLAENDVPAAHAAALQLQQTLPPDAAVADRVKALNVLTRAEVYLGRTAQAASHAEQALTLARAAGDRIGQAEADLNISLNAVNEGRIELLRRVTTDSIAALENVQDPVLRVEAMLRTSVMYRRYGQLEESVAMAMQAMEVAQHSGEPLALAYAHQGLGIANEQSFRREEAQQHFGEMLKAARAARSRLLEASALQGLGSHGAATGELHESERLYREALALYRSAGAPLYAAHAMYGLADNLMKQGRHREALPLLDQMAETYRHGAIPIGLWYTLNLRSELHLALHDTRAAREDAQEAYRAAQSVGFPLYINGSAQRLAALEAAEGNYRRAYEYTQEAASAIGKASDERASARMLELTQRYEQQAQRQAIAELKHHNELQAAALQQQALQQRWLWTLLLAVLLALLGTGYFLLRLRRSSEAIRQLNAGLAQRVQEATAEQREQASYLRTLIDTLPLMVWMKDTQGRYLAVNQATAEACGHRVEHMVGREDAELWPASVARTLQATDADVIGGRRLKTVEAPLLVGRNTASSWYEFHMAPVLDGDEVLGLVGAAQDVSARKAAEAAREAALAEAQRLARQRSEFLAQMSHELRTPLNGILGFAQILQRDKSLTERQARGLAVIDQSGQHLLALINDILDLARIDAAKLDLHPTEVDLPGLLAVVGDIVRVKAEEKQVMFSRQLDERLPREVRADEKRLRQVLLNLLSNAVKFTDQGEVTLTASVLPGGGPDTARIRFEVRDSGIGISEQQLQRLFQPFEQVGEAKRREGGTGLGLAISRELVRLMGGDVEVRSEPGRGSCFWFDLTLPVLKAPGALPRGDSLPTGYEGARRRVLVVDDVAQNREVLREGLVQLGFEVHEAADGAAALELARAQPPDLVLMDLSMPVMDGLEAMRRLRGMPGMVGTPVIATSGSASRESEDASRRAGAAAFLVKPLHQPVLLDAMGRVLGLRWLYADAAAPAEAWGPAQDLPRPPAADVDELLRLARMGHMRRICEHADALEQRDPRQAPLSRQLRTLAQGCQTKALVQLVERLRATPAPPPDTPAAPAGTPIG